jgi:Tol biopolymer transport system component
VQKRFLGFLPAVILLVFAPLAFGQSPLTLVSVNRQGTGSGNSSSFGQHTVFSADGRYVAFYSWAGDLATPEGGGGSIFWRDLETGVTKLVSVHRDGRAAGGSNPSMSEDGRYVAFVSQSANLGEVGDHQKWSDVFVRDMWTEQTVLGSISLSNYGATHNSLNPSLSADGRYLVFMSLASDLVQFPAGIGAGEKVNVYLRDLVQKSTKLVSIAADGQRGGNLDSYVGDLPAVSRDGRYVAFTSHASNLVEGDNNQSADLFLRDMTEGKTRLISRNREGTGSCTGGSSRFSMTPDGRFIVFFTHSPDVAGRPDGMFGGALLLHDLNTQTTRAVGIQPGAEHFEFGEGFLQITPNGRYVLAVGREFWRPASDHRHFYDICRLDTVEGTVETISVDRDGVMTANEDTYSGSISDSGRYVAFESAATNLTDHTEGQRPYGNPVRQIFLKDMATGAVQLITRDRNGLPSDAFSYYPRVSPNGKYLIFESGCDGLVENDQNGRPDLFLYPVAEVHHKVTAFPRLARPSQADMTGFAFSNSDSSPAEVILTVYDQDGKLATAPGLLNPATVNLDAGVQLARMETELFGAGLAEIQGPAWIEMKSSSLVTGFFMTLSQSVNKLDGAIPFATPFQSLVFSEVGEGPVETIFHCANPAQSPATVVFRLVRADGTITATSGPHTVAPKGVQIRSIHDLFPGAGIQPTDYVTATSDIPIAAVQYLGKGDAFCAILAAHHSQSARWQMYAPQFANDASIESWLSLINLYSEERPVFLTVHLDDGSVINHPPVNIPAGGKAVVNSADLFPPSPPGLTMSGYVRIGASNILGSVGFGDPEQSTYRAVLPLTARQPRRTVFSHIASNPDYFTGIALVNPSDFPVEARLEVFSADGSRLAATNLALPPYSRTSQLLPEYLPELLPLDLSGGSVKVSCDWGLISYALFGRWDLSSLAAIPAQVVP